MANKNSKVDSDQMNSGQDPNDLFGESVDLSKMKLDIEELPNTIADFIPRSLSDTPKTITSIKELDDLITMIGWFRSQGYHFLFRGHADKSFRLLPTIVRNKVRDYSQEKEIFESFKSISKSFGYDKYYMNSFDENLFYLGIGRHLGLFSRLIDWTAGIYEALSFLMDAKNMDKDGELFILAFQKDEVELENRDPFLIEDNKIHVLQEHYFLPDETDFPLGIYRRFRQHGFFTVQTEELLNIPLEKLAEQSGFKLFKVAIPKETKAFLKNCNELVSLDWLYVNNDEPIIKEIEKLNDRFIKANNHCVE